MLKHFKRAALAFFAVVVLFFSGTAITPAQPASAYVSDFTSYSIQNYHGAAAIAYGTSPSVVAFVVWVTCSNTGLTHHFGARKYVAYDPSQYVCPSGGTETSYGLYFYY